MIRIIFRNMEESELAKDAVRERIIEIMNRFPDLQGHRMSFTLSMDNSQFKPGPDLFKVKLIVFGKKYRDLILEKSSMSLYTALADLSDHTLERLNRYGDKKRVKARNNERKISRNRKSTTEEVAYEENGF